MKSQKIKFVISFSFIICLMILLLVACQPDRQERNAVNFKVAFADGYDNSTLPFDPAFGNESNSPSENNVIAILKSKDNLVTLCKDNNFPFFNSDDENFDRKLSRVMRTYDNSYFEENGLLFILQNEADGNLPKIDNITAEQDILTVCFSNPLQTEKSAVFTLRNMYVFIVEMKKESLENVNNVAVEKTTKGTTAEYEGRNLYSEFYSLEYAYNRGLIAENDVRSIGYYHNSGKEWKGADTEQVKKWEDFVETDYQPMEKTPKELSETIIEKIRISYVDLLNSSLKYFYEQNGMSVKKDLITEKDVNELLYYGTYNGYIAVLVKSSISFQQVTTPTIADTTFYFANGGETLLLFHNGK